jgi:hypothetical protein
MDMVDTDPKSTWDGNSNQINSKASVATDACLQTIVGIIDEYGGFRDEFCVFISHQDTSGFMQLQKRSSFASQYINLEQSLTLQVFSFKDLQSMKRWLTAMTSLKRVMPSLGGRMMGMGLAHARRDTERSFDQLEMARRIIQIRTASKKKDGEDRE